MGGVCGQSTTSANFVATPTGCANGEGIQIGIYADCGSSPLDCNSGTGSPDPLPLTGVPLIIGQTYFIVIDGYSGDICNFSVSISPPQEPITPGPTPPIQGPKKMCPYSTAIYSIPSIPGAETVTWNAPPGSTLNGNTPPLTLPAYGGSWVTVTFGNVGGSISVQPANPCRSGPVQSLSVTVAPIPPTNLPQETVCSPRDFPYTLPWGEEIAFRPPGKYSFQTVIITDIGCDSLVTQTIRVAPSYTIGPIIRYVCSDNPTFTICGETFTGPNPNIEKNCKTFLDCDSIIKVDLRTLAPVAKIILSGNNVMSCTNPSILLRSQPSPPPSVKTWRNLAGVKLGQGDTLRATAPGKYILESMMTAQGVRCAKYDTIELLQDISLPNITASGALISCDMPQPEIKGSSTTTGAVFAWTGPGNFTASTATTKVTKPGTYALSVKTPNGCSSTVQVEVLKDPKVPTVAANLAQNQPLTCARTTVALNGSANKPIASYRWVGPNGFSATGQTTSVGAPGVYTLFATDTSNCSGAATVAVPIDTIPPSISVSGGALRCPNSTARMVASATPPGTTFAWAGPNGFVASIANPLISVVGTYTVTAMAPNGCTATATAVVTLAPQMVVQVSGTPSCSGSATGSATVRVAGGGTPPFSFKWESGDTSATIANLAAGTYQVTVQDLWCQTTATIQVDTFPSAKLIRASSPTCAGQLTGMASVSVGSGVPPYAYLWSNNRTDSAIKNLAKGAYTVTVKDGNGCTTQSSVKVSSVPIFSLQLQTVSEPSGYTCRSTAVASLGTPPYTYQWSNGQTGAVAGQLPEGAFSVVVKDATGCVASRTAHCGSSLKGGGVEEVSISPNPANTHLFLSARLAYPEKIQVSLLSATGQKLFEQTYQGDLIEERIDLQDFPPGVYLLRFATQSGFQQTEFVSVVR